MSAREVIEEQLQQYRPRYQATTDLADAIVMALNEAGYKVAKLEQVGGWCELHGLCESKNVDGPGGQTPFNFPEDTPVCVVLDSAPAPKEPKP